MAYCPKCGVEVDDDVRNCPLCRFPVPDIRSASDPVSGQNMAEGRYPEPSNIYREHRQAIKNLAFFVFATIAVSAMIVLGVIKFIRPDLGPLVSYVFICVLSSILYVYFSLGFLKRSYNNSGDFPDNGVSDEIPVGHGERSGLVCYTGAADHHMGIPECFDSGLAFHSQQQEGQGRIHADGRIDC